MQLANKLRFHGNVNANIHVTRTFFKVDGFEVIPRLNFSKVPQPE